MRPVRIRVIGGAVGGRELDLEPRDVLPVISLSLLRGEPVNLGTHPDPDVVDEVSNRWVTYWMWPRRQGKAPGPLEYRNEPPPAARAPRRWFSSSA